MNYNVVVQSEESTVLAEYISQGRRAESYQSEADLEREFIKLLTELGYEYLPVHTEAELIPNLRKKLEELNDYRFSDSEWEQFFNNCIAGKNDGRLQTRFPPGHIRFLSCRRSRTGPSCCP